MAIAGDWRIRSSGGVAVPMRSYAVEERESGNVCASGEDEPSSPMVVELG
jgi:hypothetical protein